MKPRVYFLISIYIFWIVYFVAMKGIFIVYHYPRTKELDFSTILLIFSNGLKLDISFASYICVLPFILIAASVFLPKKFTKYSILTFNTLILLAVSLLLVIDLELYRAWQFRLDVTPLMYVHTPREMLASAGSSPLLLLIFIFLIVFTVAFYVFNKCIVHQVSQFSRTNILTVLLVLLLTGSLIIPIRGGFQLSPINQSSVYFSSSEFANHAAVNAMWNFFNSVVNKTYEKTNPYTYFPVQEASQKVQSLYPVSVQVPPAQRLLNTDKPNIVLVIWESLTAKVVEPLGGMKGITPQLSALSKEGILFNNVYASGNRSDKGIVAILSAYPAQPKNSIITIPNKTAHLPYLSADLKQAGYHTAFYYGGEMEFANIKSYMMKGGFEKLVGKEAFSQEDMNSKWGAHDHVVFNKLLTDLHTAPQPFFHTLFTLSSHEPFEVPAETVITGNDEQSLFLNAMHYTDQSLGEFVAKAKEQPWWENTLLIVIADHGHRLPLIDADDKSKEFHIPMLWLGGALNQHGIIIDRLSSQIDLTPTVLSQLNLSYHNFRWGKDIFNPNIKPFAYYAFNDGFGLIQPGKHVVFDNIGKRVILKAGNSLDEDVALGKSYLQMSFQDYLDR